MKKQEFSLMAVFMMVIFTGLFIGISEQSHLQNFLHPKMRTEEQIIREVSEARIKLEKKDKILSMLTTAKQNLALEMPSGTGETVLTTLSSIKGFEVWNRPGSDVVKDYQLVDELEYRDIFPVFIDEYFSQRVARTPKYVWFAISGDRKESCLTIVELDYLQSEAELLQDTPKALEAGNRRTDAFRIFIENATREQMLDRLAHIVTLRLPLRDVFEINLARRTLDFLMGMRGYGSDAAGFHLMFANTVAEIDAMIREDTAKIQAEIAKEQEKANDKSREYWFYSFAAFAVLCFFAGLARIVTGEMEETLVRHPSIRNRVGSQRVILGMIFEIPSYEQKLRKLIRQAETETERADREAKVKLVRDERRRKRLEARAEQLACEKKHTHTPALLPVQVSVSTKNEEYTWEHAEALASQLVAKAMRDLGDESADEFLYSVEEAMEDRNPERATRKLNYIQKRLESAVALRLAKESSQQDQA
ncbi:MAG: hypothetical protein WCJ29_02910 [bacterium]